MCWYSLKLTVRVATPASLEDEASCLPEVDKPGDLTSRYRIPALSRPVRSLLMTRAYTYLQGPRRLVSLYRDVSCKIFEVLVALVSLHQFAPQIEPEVNWKAIVK